MWQSCDIATGVRSKSSRNSSAKKVLSSHGTNSGNLPYGIVGRQRSLTPATDVYTRGPPSSEYQRAPRPKTVSWSDHNQVSWGWS